MQPLVFALDIQLGYEGQLLELPERRPSEEEIRETEEGLRKVAGFMLRYNADRVKSAHKDDLANVHFHFDH
jgi:NCS2 family nucleobase:cation symporter-2